MEQGMGSALGRKNVARLTVYRWINQLSQLGEDVGLDDRKAASVRRWSETKGHLTTKLGT
jgi:hypothetical protein